MLGLRFTFPPPQQSAWLTARLLDLWANLREVVALARCPNVAMKATGAPTFPDIHDKLRWL